MREKIARNAERQRRAMLINDINPGRNPFIIGMMLMVMLIIGGLVVGRANLASKYAGGKTASVMYAEDELHALRVALERFKIDCGRYPTPDEGLKALVINPGITNWDGNYVNIVKPDPWRTPYLYRVNDTNMVLLSAGPDHTPDTTDDIRPATPTPDEIKRKDKKKSPQGSPETDSEDGGL